MAQTLTIISPFKEKLTMVNYPRKPKNNCLRHKKRHLRRQSKKWKTMMMKNTRERTKISNNLKKMMRRLNKMRPMSNRKLNKAKK